METYIKKSELVNYLEETLKRKRFMYQEFKNDNNDDMMNWYLGQIDMIKIMINELSI